MITGSLLAEPAGLPPPLSVAFRVAAALFAAWREGGEDEDSGKLLPAGWSVFRSEYATGPWNLTLESHRRFVDFHVVLAGAESVALRDAGEAESIGPYDESGDVEFYRVDSATFVDLQAGGFAAFGTMEAHMPKVSAGAPATVRKLVLKIPVGAFDGGRCEKLVPMPSI